MTHFRSWELSAGGSNNNREEGGEGGKESTSPLHSVVRRLLCWIVCRCGKRRVYTRNLGNIIGLDSVLKIRMRNTVELEPFNVHRGFSCVNAFAISRVGKHRQVETITVMAERGRTDAGGEER